MLRNWRLKKIHARFLESCRNLAEGRDYWARKPGFIQRFLENLSPVPLLGLHEEGSRLFEALRWLELHCKGDALREEHIRQYHRLISKPGEPTAGEYRRGQATVLDSKVSRPRYEKVAAFMKQLDAKLQHQQEELDAGNLSDRNTVLRLALEIHQRIAFIHPFADGNGRVARLATNHILRRYGDGYVIFPPLSESPDHFHALEEAHLGNLEPLFNFARSCYHAI